MAFRWRRTSRTRPVRADRQPLVLRPAAGDLDGRAAATMAAQANAAGDGLVVIDLTAVTSFDSDGIGMIAELAESSAGRVSIDGFAAATQRIVGLGDAVPDAVSLNPGQGIEATRIRQVAVLRPVAPQPLRDGSLERLVAGQADDVTTVVVDLVALGDLDAASVQGIAFASSGAAARDREVLVVNVSEASLTALRRVGLSGRTWLAPATERSSSG